MTVDTISSSNRELPLFCDTNSQRKNFVTHPESAGNKEKKRILRNMRSRFIRRCHLLQIRSSLQKTLAALYYFASNDADSLLNPHGHWCCFPSVESIAKRADLGVRTVYKHLKILKDKGYINYRNRYRLCPKTDQYRQTSNVYYLVTNKIETESHILAERLKATRDAVCKAIRKGKEAVRKGTPKALTYGKKQKRDQKHFSGYGKDKTSHFAARYEEANRLADEDYAARQAIQCDSKSWIEKAKSLLKKHVVSESI